MIGKEILNYTILSLIGSGGMGSVYLAENKYIRQQKVAIKVINANMVNDFTRQRMKEEAEHLASLNHPNIVRFMNYHADEDGNIYLIMEYAEGMSMDKFISKKNGLIVEERIGPMFEPLLDAVGYAHRKRILHRDIKPNNIIITPDGTPKILDFGIATLMREDSDATGQIIGTPSYMSPEQVKGDKLDERSDIYSLGVVLFQMMTGRQPYDTTTMNEMEILQKVSEEKLPPMRGYYKHISDKVQAVVDKATEKDKQKRYASCQEFKHALHSALYPNQVSLGAKIGIAAAILILIGGCFGWWDYSREKVHYYNDYTEVYGIPQGIGRLSVREQQHRRASYRMSYQKGKLREMMLVNAHGTPVEHSDTEFMNKRYCYTKFFYTAEGKIDYKEVYSATMRPLFKMDYSDNLLTITFRRFDTYETEAPVRMQTTALQNVDDSEKSRISRYLLTYDPNGHIATVMYAGLGNSRVCDGDGIYGICYSYDEKGREVEEHFVDATGKIKGNSFDLAQKFYTYDEQDHWTSVRYVNTNGGASHDGNHVYECRISYDQWGNRSAEKYYDINGQAACRSDMKAFGLTYKMNDSGDLVEYTYLGDQWHPALNGNAFQTIRYEYNTKGYITRMAFFAPNKNKEFVRSLQNDTIAQTADSTANEPADDLQPVLGIFKENNLYYAAREMEYDERGNETLVRFYDTDNHLMEQGNGVAQFVFSYDEHSNLMERSALNAQSAPTPLAGGQFYEIYEYDSLDQQVSISFLDSTRQPCTLRRESYSKVTTDYNAHGDVLRYSYMDTQNNLILNSDGIAQFEMEYDAIGNHTGTRYYDTKGQLTMMSRGFARLENRYDEKTNFPVSSRYYDANDKLIFTSIRQYDERGNIIAEYQTDSKGAMRTGTVYTHNIYDDNNRLIEIYYTDLSDKRINRSASEPFSSVRRAYDQNGNITEQTFWDTKGKPTTDLTLTHRRVNEYDAMQRIIHQTNYGINGKPIDFKKEKAEGRVEYDAYGNMAQITTYDGYQNPVAGPDGVYRIDMQYDWMGNQTVIEYYDTRNQLVVSKEDGYARRERKYNDRQLDIEDRFYNQQKQIIRIETSEYNRSDNLTVWNIYDGQMQPDDSHYGFSKMEILYDKTGMNRTRRQVYNSKGKMMAYSVYNEKNDSWGEWQFVNTGNTSSGRSSARSSHSATNTSAQWKKNVEEVNSELPTSFSEGSLSVRWKKIEITSSGKVCLSKFEIDKSQYEVLPSEITDLKAKLNELMTLIKQKLDIPASVKMTYELYDNKNRKL